MSVLRLSHIGLCVSNLERSVAFYRDALGFCERSSIDVSGDDAAALLDLDSVELRAVYLERDGTRIELLHFGAPECTDGPGPRPVNRLGLTHLSLRVDDLDTTIHAVEQAGGRCLTSSRIANPRFGMQAVFVVDPDGLRIELLQAANDPGSLPGA